VSPLRIKALCPEVNRVPYYRQCRRTYGERFASEATRGAQLFRLVKQHETAPTSRGSADRNRKFALSIIRILFRLPTPNEARAEVLHARIEEGRARLSRKPASRARTDEATVKNNHTLDNPVEIVVLMIKRNYCMGFNFEWDKQSFNES
jgi:hypothetical protein